MSQQVLTAVKPFLTYAQQMRDTVPIMAYHCKLLAVQRGLDMVKSGKAAGQDTDGAKSQLIGELTDLETLKKNLPTTDKDELNAYVNNFVLTVFAKADKEEREVEIITKKHALDFKRLNDFIQVLTLFGELDADWETKRKYCVFKAGSIMQALKVGKQPDFRGNPNDPVEEKKAEEDVFPLSPSTSGLQTQDSGLGGLGGFGGGMPSQQDPMSAMMDTGMSAQPSQYQTQQPTYQPSQPQQPTYQTYQPQQQPQYQPQQPQYQPQQFQQPVAQPMQMTPQSQQPMKKDATYYKAINEGQRLITNAKKQLKYGIVEEAATHLRHACNVLAPYDSVKYDIPQGGQGYPANGPAFVQAMEGAKVFTDNASQELQFTRIDAAYQNAIKALTQIMPYCKP